MTATLRTDFDAFLYAPIGEDANGLPLTLLTIFARLGVDPWEEAADLAALPVEPAMQRLASRLEASPSAPASPADTVNIVTRLIALLHRAPPRKAAAPEPLVSVKVFERFKGSRLAIYCAIGALFLLLAQCASP
ncbi:MAG: hypothetical protein ABUL69_01540 [Peristeroidobacter soli]